MGIDIDIDRNVEVDVDVEIDEYFGCFKAGFNATSGTVEWYGSSYGTDFSNSEIASPVSDTLLVPISGRGSQ